MNSKPIQVLLHIVGWVFLYILPYLFSFEGLTNYQTLFSNRGDYIHLTSFILLVGYVYLGYFYLVPKLYLQRKYVLYFILVCVCFWIVISLPMEVHVGNAPPPPDVPHGPGGPHKGHGQPLLFGKNYSILLFVISTFATISFYTRRQLQKIENEKLNTELLFLRAQINPHFLFNTLNSIYSLAIQKDDRTPDAIVHLSELMRYTLKDVKEHEVLLDKEINYIDNYIALQQARLGDTVTVHYKKEGLFGGKKIAPLMLISFIENAFKHGVNPNEHSEITINISADNSELKLHVKNKQVSSVNEEGGIGIQNIKERLQHLYPAKHSLTINDNNDSYVVELVISMQ